MTESLLGYRKVAEMVVVLGPTPTTIPSFATCLGGTTDVSHCSGLLTLKDANSVESERLATAYGKARFIDTTPWFCVDLTCPPVIDGSPGIFDGSHITAEIAPKFAPLLQARLRELGVLSS